MVISFLKKNAKTIFYVITWGILIYVILLRGIKIDDSYKKEIKNLETSIKEIQTFQKKLDSNINGFNSQILNVETEINGIQGDKTIIREVYYEKINNVNNYSDKQLDSFFTERYNYPY
jgi:predicted  nucleic acid-binding Zn-ribbon protein